MIDRIPAPEGLSTRCYDPAMRLIRAVLAGSIAAAVIASPALPDAPSRGQVLLPSGRVLQAEVADTPAKRARGYMHRGKIGDDEGMVFLMESVGFHSFWMKNCKVPLDIAWLDESWKIVHLEQEVPPCPPGDEDPCPSVSPMQAALYVLEVRGGLAAKEGLKIGSRIVFTPPPGS